MLIPTALRPVRMVDRKSSADLSRFSRASKSYYADSSVRPLRRRAARMARPARVFMRRRKPWVFARRRVFGWKVRLLIRCYSKTFGGSASKVDLRLKLGEPKAEQPVKLTPQKAWWSSFYPNYLIFFKILFGSGKVGFHNILEKMLEMGLLDLQFHSVRQLNTRR